MAVAEIWIDDRIKRLTGVRCVVCERLFFVLPELLPRRCCYCGTRFRWDVNDPNAVKSVHGFRITQHDADNRSNDK